MWEVENNPDILCMDKDENAEEFLCEAYGIEKPVAASSSPVAVMDVAEVNETTQDIVEPAIDDKPNDDKEASNEGFEFSDNDSEDMGPLYSKLIIIVGGSDGQEGQVGAQGGQVVAYGGQVGAQGGQGGLAPVVEMPDSSTVTVEHEETVAETSGNEEVACNIRACWVRVEKVSQEVIDRALLSPVHDLVVTRKSCDVMDTITIDSDDNHSVMSSITPVLAPLSLVSKPLDLTPRPGTQATIIQTTNTKPLFEKILENLRNEKIASAASAKKMREKRRERIEKKEKEEKENGKKSSNDITPMFDNLFNKKFTILGSGMKIGKKVVTTVAEVDSTVDDVIDLVDDTLEDEPSPSGPREVQGTNDRNVNEEAQKWFDARNLEITPFEDVTEMRTKNDKNTEAEKCDAVQDNEITGPKENVVENEESEEAQKWCKARDRDITPPGFNEDVNNSDVGNHLLMDQRERRAYIDAVRRGPRKNFGDNVGPRHFNNTRGERRRYDGGGHGGRARERWDRDNKGGGFNKCEHKGFARRELSMNNHNQKHSVPQRGFNVGNESEPRSRMDLDVDEGGHKLREKRAITGGEERPSSGDGGGVIEIEDDDDVEVIDVVVNKTVRVRPTSGHGDRVEKTNVPTRRVHENYVKSVEAEEGEICEHGDSEHPIEDTGGRVRWFEIDQYNRRRSPPRYCDLVENKVIDPPPSDNDVIISDRYHHLWTESDQLARSSDSGRKIQSYEDYEEYLARRPPRHKRTYQDTDRPMVSQVDKSFDVWRKYIEAKRQWKEHQRQRLLFLDEEPLTPPPQMIHSNMGGPGGMYRYRCAPGHDTGPYYPGFEPHDYYELDMAVYGGHYPGHRYPPGVPLVDGDPYLYSGRHRVPGPPRLHDGDHCHYGHVPSYHSGPFYCHPPHAPLNHRPYHHQPYMDDRDYPPSSPPYPGNKTDTPASPDPPSDHGNDFTMIPSPKDPSNVAATPSSTTDHIPTSNQSESRALVPPH